MIKSLKFWNSLFPEHLMETLLDDMIIDGNIPTVHVELEEVEYIGGTDMISNFDYVAQTIRIYKAYRVRDVERGNFFIRKTDELLNAKRLKAQDPSTLKKVRRQWLRDNGVKRSVIKYHHL